MSREAFWDRILGTARDIDSTSYYDLLGVAPTADGDAVRDAYYTLVRRLHPDRHAREADERKRALTVVYARIGEAYRVLSAPASRKQYDRDLDAGRTRYTEPGKRGQADTRDPRTPKAIDLFAAGKQLLAAGDARGARARWDLALQFEPDSKALAQAIAELDAAAEQRLRGKPKPTANGGADAQAASTKAVAGTGAVTTPIAVAGSAPLPAAAAAPSEPARADTRHLLARPVKIRCSDWDKVRTLYTRDISRGGMFLRTSRPLALQTQLRIILDLPDGQELSIDAEVVRVVTPEQAGKKGPGVGVRFLDADAKRQKLERILDALPTSRAHIDAARAAETTRPPRRIVHAPPPAPAIASPTDPTEIEVLAALRAQIRELRSLGPHARLGAAEGSDSRTLRRRYLELAKRSHPDLYRRYAATDIHDAASEVFVLIRKAFRKLEKKAHQPGAPELAPPPRSSPPPLPPLQRPSVPATHTLDQPLARLGYGTETPPRVGDASDFDEPAHAVSGPVFVRPAGKVAADATRRPDAGAPPNRELEPSASASSLSIDDLFDESTFVGLEEEAPAPVWTDEAENKARAERHLRAARAALTRNDERRATTEFEAVLRFDKHCAEAIAFLRRGERGRSSGIARLFGRKEPK